MVLALHSLSHMYPGEWQIFHAEHDFFQNFGRIPQSPSGIMVIKHKLVYDAMMLLRVQKGADEARRQMKKILND